MNSSSKRKGRSINISVSPKLYERLLKMQKACGISSISEMLASSMSDEHQKKQREGDDVHKITSNRAN